MCSEYSIFWERTLGKVEVCTCRRVTDLRDADRTNAVKMYLGGRPETGYELSQGCCRHSAAVARFSGMNSSMVSRKSLNWAA